MKNLELCGHNVRVNDDDFVCLTDMWKASGGKSKHLAGKFINNESTQGFIHALELKTGYPVLKTIKGGRSAGTWADKLVAYKYAGWIDPDFEVGTYTVLEKFFSGELVHQGGWDALHDYVIDERYSKKLGSFHGKGLSHRRKEISELKARHRQLLEEFQMQLELESLI